MKEADIFNTLLDYEIRGSWGMPLKLFPKLAAKYYHWLTMRKIKRWSKSRANND